MIVADDDSPSNLEARLGNLLAWRALIARPPAWMERRIRELAAEIAARPVPAEQAKTDDPPRKPSRWEYAMQLANERGWGS